MESTFSKTNTTKKSQHVPLPTQCKIYLISPKYDLKMSMLFLSLEPVQNQLHRLRRFHHLLQNPQGDHRQQCLHQPHPVEQHP